MCGICGIFLRNPKHGLNLDNILDGLLLGVENRGRHATGFVAISEAGVAEWQKASCAATTFVKHRRPIPEGSMAIIGHTRHWTQGEPAFMENNHPIKRGPFFIVHNGHVLNDAELFENAKRERYGRVDSEAIAARLASFGDLGRLGEVMEEIQGGAAVAAVDERDPRRIVLARGKNNPLHIYVTDNFMLFASTRDAIAAVFKAFIGTMSNKKFDWLAEGQMYDFNHADLAKSRFVVPKSQWEIDRDERIAMGEGAGWSIVPGREHVWRRSSSSPVVPRHGHGLLYGGAAYSTAEGLDKKERQRKADEENAVLNPEHYWNCDNCDSLEHWTEMDYRYVPEEEITWLLCPQCQADLGDEWPSEKEFDPDDDEDRFVNHLRLIEPVEEDEDHEGIDNYEKANRSILEGLKGFFL